MVCTASQVALMLGILIGILAVSTSMPAAQLRKHAAADLADMRRQMAAGGLRGLFFRLGYPFIWFIYLPSRGFLLTLTVAALLMLPAAVFC
jgi:uncharacterized membrane protein